MNIKSFVLIFYLSAMFGVNAFSQSISGKVTDAVTKEPLVGVVIVEKATNKHAITKLDGSFNLLLSPGDRTLTIQCLGYITQEQSLKLTNSEVLLNVELQSSVMELEAVTVTASAGTGSEISSRLSEKLSYNILNSMSYKVIELSPDITVANVLQRISGVSIEKTSQGEGRYPIIRGMDRRYSYTLINGIKIPSPDNNNRYVPMDLFPAELLEKLDVVKVLTPDMESDAIAGGMNLIMKNAPRKFFINANIATEYNSMSLNNDFQQFGKNQVMRRSPEQKYGSDFMATPDDFTFSQFNYKNRKVPVDFIGGVSVGSRFLGDKLGILVSVSHQNKHRISQSTRFADSGSPLVNNDVVFSSLLSRQYSAMTDRTGVNTKLDYRINKNNSVALYGLYVNLDETQAMHVADTVLNMYLGPGNVEVVKIRDRSRFQRQSIYSVTVGGNHRLSSAFDLDWTATYSQARNDMPGWSEFITDHKVKNFVASDDWYVQRLNYAWRNNNDRDITLIAGMSYRNPSWKPDTYVKAGILYRSKQRENYHNDYEFFPKPINGEYQTFTTFEDAIFYFANPDEGRGNAHLTYNTYEAYEDALHYYVQAKHTIGRLNMLGGVRIENTEQRYDTRIPERFEGKSGSKAYSDILPSVHLKYLLTEEQNLRLSYFKGLCRPSFFDIVPYEMSGDNYIEGGNMRLKRSRAHNIDVRYEYFPSGTVDQLLVGIFYKSIQDVIETSVCNEPPKGMILRPTNTGDAHNYGAELVLTKYIRNIGFSVNYTFTQSEVTTNKIIRTYVTDESGDTQILNREKQQTRPLQGQAKHIGNASLLYKNQQIGFNAQLSSVYTGKRITWVSPYYSLDHWQEAMVTLDFSMEKTIVGKSLSLFIKVNNILNTHEKTVIDCKNINPDKYPLQTCADYYWVEKRTFGISSMVGLRFKM